MYESLDSEIKLRHLKSYYTQGDTDTHFRNTFIFKVNSMNNKNKVNYTESSILIKSMESSLS